VFWLKYFRLSSLKLHYISVVCLGVTFRKGLKSCPDQNYSELKNQVSNFVDERNLCYTQDILLICYMQQIIDVASFGVVHTTPLFARSSLCCLMSHCIPGHLHIKIRVIEQQVDGVVQRCCLYIKKCWLMEVMGKWHMWPFYSKNL
jgi:hypothetical protein